MLGLLFYKCSTVYHALPCGMLIEVIQHVEHCWMLLEKSEILFHFQYKNVDHVEWQKKTSSNLSSCQHRNICWANIVRVAIHWLPGTLINRSYVLSLSLLCEDIITMNAASKNPIPAAVTYILYLSMGFLWKLVANLKGHYHSMVFFYYFKKLKDPFASMHGSPKIMA